VTDPTVVGRSPFVEALGDDFGRLAPALRRHLAQAQGASLLVGGIRHCWRRGGPLGWLLARILRLDFGPLTTSARFEVRNEMLPGGAMLWRRSLRDGATAVEAFGIVRWDARRGALVDTLGRRQSIEVELLPRVEEGALRLSSRWQWIRLLGLRVPLPAIVAGHARVRESALPGGRILLRLTLSHRCLGEYAGYEAELAEAE